MVRITLIGVVVFTTSLAIGQPKPSDRPARVEGIVFSADADPISVEIGRASTAEPRKSSATVSASGPDR